MKKYLITILLAFAFIFTGCTVNVNTIAKPVANLPIIHEEEFGGAYIRITIEDFNALGYEYGDSVDVILSNGYEFNNIPYYNGYYAKNGDIMLLAYPGYDYIKLVISNGADIWERSNLTDKMFASIYLNGRGEYLEIQNARDIHYTDERDDYDSDEIFANFRAIKVSGLKENYIYRSASPCDNRHNRASYADKLASKAGVNYILDLADTKDKIEGYLTSQDFDSAHFKSLYDLGNVNPIAMNMNYDSEEFKKKVATGIKEMANNSGPYLIHCTEGKDRTGYVCMLIEALVGASYEDIKNDYMITYNNYYGVTRESDEKRYDILVSDVLDPMIRSMANDEKLDLNNANLSEAAKNFLIETGLSEAEVDDIKNKLSSY
ncbi:MAG: tyrosine-protein phosphatase [Lachnospiraceae bacterium]|nr:tyrosine-protein phosphatase [Lachnospiraceae bacterium]